MIGILRVEQAASGPRLQSIPPAGSNPNDLGEFVANLIGEPRRGAVTKEMRLPMRTAFKLNFTRQACASAM